LDFDIRSSRAVSAPFETRYVDFADTLKNLGLDQMSGEGNLLFSFTGRAGDLVLWTGSVDQSANFVFPVEPEGVGKSMGKASGYWTVANGFDTMYTVFNPTDKSEDIVATFHNGDGSDGYELPIHLEAQASTMIDLMELIEAARPDTHGKVIPKTMPNGGVVFESAEGRAKWMTLVVSGGIYNAHRATCTRTCISCYGYSYFQVSPSSFTVPVRGTEDLSASTVYFDGSIWVCGINIVCAWSSSNTNVATVAVGGTVATVTGRSAGSVSISAQFPPMVIYTGQICSTTGQPTCPQASPAPASSGNVRLPHHLQVISDDNGVVYQCQTIVGRQIKMKVVDISNQVVGLVPVRENFVSITTNTCGNGQPLPTQCGDTDNANSEFTDNITVNCNNVGGSCGYNLTDEWQWCPLGSLPVNIGRLVDTVHANAITVNGVTTPNRIASGTNIYRRERTDEGWHHIGLRSVDDVPNPGFCTRQLAKDPRWIRRDRGQGSRCGRSSCRARNGVRNERVAPDGS
jgi:hypothetical protein